MITIPVDRNTVYKEYKKEAVNLLNLFRKSDSRYKDIDDNKIVWYYTFSYFIKREDKNDPEYYNRLHKMSYEDRLKEELKKVRVSIGFSANYFYISDRVDGIPEIVRKTVEDLTHKKMLFETELLNMLDTFPLVIQGDEKPLDLKEQLQKAIEMEDYEKAASIRDKINKNLI